MSLGLPKCLELNFRGFSHLNTEIFSGEDPRTPHIKTTSTPYPATPLGILCMRCAQREREREKRKWCHHSGAEIGNVIQTLFYHGQFILGIFRSTVELKLEWISTFWHAIVRISLISKWYYNCKLNSPQNFALSAPPLSNGGTNDWRTEGRFDHWKLRMYDVGNQQLQKDKPLFLNPLPIVKGKLKRGSKLDMFAVVDCFADRQHAKNTDMLPKRIDVLIDIGRLDPSFFSYK